MFILGTGGKNSGGNNQLWFGRTAATGDTNPLWIQAVTTGFAFATPLSLNPEGGNVGVGTNAPAAPLHIAGGLTTTGAQLFLETNEPTVVNNDVVGDIDFRGLDSGVRTAARIRALATGTWGADTDSAGTSLQFFTQDNTNTDVLTAPRMTIDSVGNVGVGTASPSYPLHIVDNGSPSTSFRAEGNGTKIISIVSNDADTWLQLTRGATNKTAAVQFVDGGGRPAAASISLRAFFIFLGSQILARLILDTIKLSSSSQNENAIGKQRLRCEFDFPSKYSTLS